MIKDKYFFAIQKSARKASAVALLVLIMSSVVALASITAPNLSGKANTALAGTFPGANGQIAFVSTRDGGNAEIYAMGADGSGPTRVTMDPAATPFVDGNPSWSPDGSKIAFWSTRAGGGIHVMNADGSGIIKIGDGREPSWSPDGSKIAFTSSTDGNDEIYVMNADGSGKTRLTNEAASDIKPSWSPDGSKIAFTSGRVDDDTTTDTDIYVMNADGSGVIRLINDPANNLGANDVAPNWSPDGSRIAFQSNRGFIPSEIYSMKADGTDLQRLTNNGNVDTEPSWSPDGSRIAFQSNRDGNFEIYSVKATDGTDSTRLTNIAASDTEPDWGTHVPDTTPPTVVSTDPADGAANVPISTDVKATFSEPMDGATITTSTFTLASSSGSVTGTVNYDSATNTAKLLPSSPLAYSTNYTAKIANTVKDAAGNSMAADYSWSFTTQAAPNQPPTANAGPDQTVNEGATVSLNGSGSSDPDGDTLTYAWTQTAGTAATLSDASSATPSFTAPNVGSNGDTLTFELRVTDNDGATATDTVSVIVTNVNQAPVAKITANPTTINEGDSSALDATGSSDPDGTITTYEFSQTAGTAGTITVDGTNPAKATFNAASVSADETATIQVKVTDNDGATSTATVDIAVKNVNQAPTANAGPDQTVNEGDSVSLDGSGSSDPDGDTLTYAWTQTAGPSVTLDDATSKTPSFTAPNVDSAGATLTFKLAIDDGNGHTATDTVDIKVKDVPPPPDTIPPDTKIDSAVDAKGKPISNGGSTTSNTITFKFSGTDNSGVASFQCSKDSPTLFSPCTSPLTYTKITKGMHTFIVKAIDTSGNEDPTPAKFTWSKPK